MRFDVLTIFPQAFSSYLNESVLKRAQAKKLLKIVIHDIREYSKDKHKKVDDTPYGGGAGMIMTCQPIYDCLKAIKKINKGPVIFLCPDGQKLTHKKSKKLAELEEMILLCGRYEGIDQRIRDNFVDKEISIGNYVLTGGELPAMVLIDAVSRQIKGVLGHEYSPEEESFSEILQGKKEYPQYTKPADFLGHKVPEILLSGHHEKIKKWRFNKLK